MGGRDAARYDTASDKFYLRYAAARLAAYSNVWWCFLRPLHWTPSPLPPRPLHLASREHGVHP